MCHSSEDFSISTLSVGVFCPLDHFIWDQQQEKEREAIMKIMEWKQTFNKVILSHLACWNDPRFEDLIPAAWGTLKDVWVTHWPEGCKHMVM